MTSNEPAPDERAVAVAERVANVLLDIQSKSFDRAAAYTNLVMFGGYAGAFTIWNFTRDQLSGRASVSIGLLLTISLATFVFFEVFKMVFISRQMMKQRAILAKNPPEAQLNADLKDLQNSENRSVAQWVMPIWQMCLFVALTTALAAVALLLWNFSASLLGWCPWP